MGAVSNIRRTHAFSLDTFVALISTNSYSTSYLSCESKGIIALNSSALGLSEKTRILCDNSYTHPSVSLFSLL